MSNLFIICYVVICVYRKQLHMHACCYRYTVQKPSACVCDYISATNKKLYSCVIIEATSGALLEWLPPAGARAPCMQASMPACMHAGRCPHACMHAPCMQVGFAAHTCMHACRHLPACRFVHIPACGYI